jgi:hypothetical protein
MSGFKLQVNVVTRYSWKGIRGGGKEGGGEGGMGNAIQKIFFKFNFKGLLISMIFGGARHVPLPREWEHGEPRHVIGVC